MEAVAISEEGEGVCQFGDRDESHRLTGLTHHVQVVMFEGQMPTPRLIPEMDVMDESDAGELVEGAVTGRGVDRAGAVRGHAREDLLRRDELLAVSCEF